MRTGGEGVAFGAKSAGQLGTSLQHCELCVLLHNITDLTEQQIEVLKDHKPKKKRRSRRLRRICIRQFSRSLSNIKLSEGAEAACDHCDESQIIMMVIEF